MRLSHIVKYFYSDQTFIQKIPSEPTPPSKN